MESFPSNEKEFKSFSIKLHIKDFPGSPVVKTPCFHCRRHGFDPLSGKFHKLWGAAKKWKHTHTPILRVLIWWKMRVVLHQQVSKFPLQSQAYLLYEIGCHSAKGSTHFVYPQTFISDTWWGTMLLKTLPSSLVCKLEADLAGWGCSDPAHSKERTGFWSAPEREPLSPWNSLPAESIFTYLGFELCHTVYSSNMIFGEHCFCLPGGLSHAVLVWL